MSRVTRTEQRYDDELAAVNKCRVIRCESLDTGVGFVSREVIVDNQPELFDRTPWWKRAKPRRRKKS